MFRLGNAAWVFLQAGGARPVGCWVIFQVLQADGVTALRGVEVVQPVISGHPCAAKSQ